jgi:hypothetical protein
VQRPLAIFTRSGRALAACMAACLLALGCGVEPCNPAIDPNGGRYDVYVDTLYPFASTMNDRPGVASRGSCAGFDGVVPGATLTLETAGAIGNIGFCRSVVAGFLTAPSALTPLPAPSDPLEDGRDFYGQLFMEARADVATADCSGLAIFLFFEGGTMYRAFEPASGTCLPCDDNFSIEMIRL